MAKAPTIQDVRMNEAVTNAVVDDHPKQVSGMVGITALGKLAEMMPHDEFVAFVEGALHHAQTEQMPEQEGQQEQGGEQA